MSDYNENMKFLEFVRTETPQPVERKQGDGDNKWTMWGVNNLYPNFLLEMYGECSLHASIIKGKIKHIMGDGLVIKGENTKANFDVNNINSLDELVRNITYDYCLFNFFAIEVQYNMLNQPFKYTHIPAHQIRTNQSRTKFWVSSDWQLRREVTSLDRWCKGSNKDGKSKLFFYTGYNPTVNIVYPDVQYKSGITSMRTDVLVKQFFKNNVEDGFSPAHIITFFKGKPSEQETRLFERKFADAYSGASGLKYIMSFANPDVQKPVQIDTIDVQDFANKMIEVNKKVETDILTAHEATSPLLFGIKTEGQLGGATETETAFEMFKNLWVKDTRNVIENGLNKLFMDGGKPEIEFKDKTSLFTATLDTTTREKVLTINELRAIDGRPPLPDGDKLIADSVKVPDTAGGVVDNNTFVDENPFKNGRTLKDEDFEQVKHLGKSRSEYHSLSDLKKKLKFDKEDDIENYLMKNDLDGKSLDEIKDAIQSDLDIDISVDDLEERINKLTEAGIIESEIIDGEVKHITPVDETNEAGRSIEVMYEYKVRPGFGEDLLPTSRGFCVRLIENDRLYTDVDIQTMSEIFGYDVFKHAGGWYTDPDTGEHQDQCRHQFKSIRVVRKQTNN